MLVVVTMVLSVIVSTGAGVDVIAASWVVASVSASMQELFSSPGVGMVLQTVSVTKL